MGTRTNRTRKKTADWQRDFLQALEAEGMVNRALEVAGVAKTTAYEARHRDPEFAAAWDHVEETTTQRMEREAYRRGIEGVDRPVFQGGKEVGAIREYSDTLLIFMLKARRPQVYRERHQLEHTGPDGGPIKMTLAELTRRVDDEGD